MFTFVIQTLSKRADKLCWSSEMFLGLCFQRQDFWPLFWNWYFYRYTTCKQSLRCLCACDKWSGNRQGFTRSGSGLRICSDKNAGQLQMIVQVWALVGAILPSINHLVFRSTPREILDEPEKHRCSHPADQTERTPPPPRLNKIIQKSSNSDITPLLLTLRLSSQLETS